MNARSRYGGTRRLPRRFALALGVILAVTAVGAPQAMALTSDDDPLSRTQAIEFEGPPPAGFASWTELLTVQGKLVRAADRLTEAAGEGKVSGFAGIVLEPEQRRLRLHWKGGLPQQVNALVGELRAEQVGVATMPAAYSAHELAVEASKITGRAGGTVTSVKPAADGSGLTVTALTAAVAGAKRLATATMKADLSIGDVTVPVTVEPGTPSEPLSRFNDAPRWKGGAAIDTRGHKCSTGFAVRHNGVAKLLSAGHCFTDLGDKTTDAVGQRIGFVSHGWSTSDMMMIDPDAFVAPVIYNNSTNFAGDVTNEFTNRVMGATSSYEGMWVCTSGAYSGTRCNIRVQSNVVSKWFAAPYNYWTHGMAEAVHFYGQNAGGEADSGGPVMVVDGANPALVYAAGTISSGSTVASCTGYVKVGRTCHSTITYTPWHTVISTFGGNLSVVTDYGP